MSETRLSGKTTRNVDRWIQEFFTNGFTFIYEGRGSDSFRRQTDEGLTLFRRRLELEHPKAKYTFLFGTYEGILCYKVEKHNL